MRLGRTSAGGVLLAVLLLAGVLIVGVVTGRVGSASPEAAGPTVVSVLADGSEHATGFVVAPGRVVTVAHAVGGDAAPRVAAGRSAPRRARVLRLDARADLALLAVPGLGGRAAGVAAAGHRDGVRLGLMRDERPVARPAGVRRAIDARVSAPGAGRGPGGPALELEARVRGGDSGAPVLTHEGEVAGVLFARSLGRDDTAYAVDAGVLVEFLYRNGGVTRRGPGR